MFEVSDAIMVLKDGKPCVGLRPTADTEAEIVKLMVGQGTGSRLSPKASDQQRNDLDGRISRYTLAGTMVHDISLTIPRASSSRWPAAELAVSDLLEVSPDYVRRQPDLDDSLDSRPFGLVAAWNRARHRSHPRGPQVARPGAPDDDQPEHLRCRRSSAGRRAGISSRTAKEVATKASPGHPPRIDRARSLNNCREETSREDRRQTRLVADPREGDSGPAGPPGASMWEPNRRSTVCCATGQRRRRRSSCCRPLESSTTKQTQITTTVTLPALCRI